MSGLGLQHKYYPLKLFCRLVSLVIFFALVSGSAYAKWPTTKYEVRQSLNPLSERLSGKQVADIEDMMHRYAVEFERQGWPAPHHEAMTFSGDAYLVYVKEYPNGPSVPRAQSDCHDSRAETKILIDPVHWKKELAGSNSAKNWQDLAHEMFHTIQYSYPSFKNCKNGNEFGHWVTEATADAVGIDMARKVAGLKPYSFCQIGVRNYNRNLYLRKSHDQRVCGKASYGTKSFWEYLAEWKVKRAPPLPTKEVDPDFSYLDSFFKTRPKKYDVDGELNWLNNGLKEEFGFSLREAYTNFVAAFSGYAKSRKKHYGGSLNLSTPGAWQKQIFGKCQTLAHGGVPSNTSIALDPMSSRCLEIHSLGSGQKSIEITAKNNNVTLLKNLTISTENGMQLVRAVMKPAGNPDRAVFNFSISGAANQEYYFIVSNAATDPFNNYKQTVDLSLSVAKSTSSSAKPTKKKKTSTKLKKQKDSSDESFEVEYLKNQGADDWHGRVSQARTGRTCEGAFVERICGERTLIFLSLIPDQLTAIESSLETSSVLDLGRRVNQLGNRAEIDKMLEHKRRLAETEGSEIRIQIPRIDYGFSGSFSNAFIEMNKPLSEDKNNDNYDTKGPDWSGSCKKGHHSYSGKVTIDETSKQVLSGRFAGEMVDPDLRGKYHCRTLPVYKSISGEFVILGPDLDEKSQDRDVDNEDIIDQVMDDVTSVAPGIITPEMQSAVREKAREAAERKQQRQQERESVRTSEDFTCDCRCERAGQTVTKPGCYQTCEILYKQCDMPSYEQITMLYDMTGPATPEEELKFERMRTEIIEWLKNENKKYVRETFITQFDEAPRMLKPQIYEQVKSRYGG